jgi:hypothetical protein
MSSTLCRLILIPCLMLAGVLAGLPDSTALERAVSKAFAAPPLVGPGMQPSPAAGAPVPAPDTLIANAALAVVPAAPPAETSGGEVPRAADRHGRLLASLYASFVTLQALDAHSTLVAIDRGARETNPMMAPLVDRPAAFVALKAGTAAGVLYMTERVRRHSPLGAVLMMAAFNSAYATVVARNYRVAAQLAR